MSEASARASGLYDQVMLTSFNSTTPLNSLHFDGEDLFPSAILPDDGGVEFRSAYTYEYQAVSEEDRLWYIDLLSQVAHCRKLLRDLPIALQNSETAMKEHGASDDVDLNTLGAMAVEQVRIRKEIANQQTSLRHLEHHVEREATIELEDRAMQLYQLQTTIVLPFGISEVDGWEYRLEKRAPIEVAPPLAIPDATSEPEGNDAVIHPSAE